MAPPATEIVFLPILSTTTISDPSTPSGKIWKEICDTLAVQPGYQRLYWGREVENLDLVHLAIDWDNVDAHHAFISSPIYSSFSAKAGNLTTNPISIYHVNYTPHPPQAATSDSPVTEILTCYKPNVTWDITFAQFGEILKASDGFMTMSAGHVIEEVEGGKAFLAAIGWTSVGAHMRFRETNSFKENIGLLRNNCERLKAVHVDFQLVRGS